MLNSQAVQTSFAANNSYFLSQAFPGGFANPPGLSDRPWHGGRRVHHGAEVLLRRQLRHHQPAGAVGRRDARSATTRAPVQRPLTVNGELHKLAHNISFGHGIHAGIHWRSDTETSIELGEAVALSYLRDRPHMYRALQRVPHQAGRLGRDDS